MEHRKVSTYVSTNAKMVAPSQTIVPMQESNQEKILKTTTNAKKIKTSTINVRRAQLKKTNIVKKNKAQASFYNLSIILNPKECLCLFKQRLLFLTNLGIYQCDSGSWVTTVTYPGNPPTLPFPYLGTYLGEWVSIIRGKYQW